MRGNGTRGWMLALLVALTLGLAACGGGGGGGGASSGGGSVSGSGI